MRPSARSLFFHATVLVALALGGCSSEQPRAPRPDISPPRTPQPAQLRPPVIEAEPSTSTTAERPSKKNLSAAAATPVAADTIPAAFEPPFPDRVDLFVAPKRQGGPAAAQGTGDTAVELMGFVRVDRLRALLLVNGEIAPLAEGETQHGIEVISLQPPNVVLQRGRQRWQASLESP